MKYSILAISILGLWNAVCAAGESAAPESENDKVIYSLGYEMGEEVKRQALDLAPEILLRGVKDAIEGNRPLVGVRARQKAMKKIKEQRAQDNLEKSQAFLTANAEREGVKTLSSGLQYREITAGKGKTPQANGRVIVHYRGNLIDGTEFDSSYERGKPATFQVKKVIKGWREALQLMKEGAKWELYIPPELAYGKRGRSKTIPPNSALVFEVELIAVE